MIKKINLGHIKRIVLIILVIAFIALLTPTLYISQYNQPSEDDYAYGSNTRKVFLDTGSVFEAFKNSIRGARDSYLHWQGTLSGIIVMAMGPMAFNIEYYTLTTLIMLFFLIVSTLFLTYKILVSYFKLDKCTWLIVAIVMLVVSIEFMPFPTHSFYWYNGSALYTIFYSLSLVVYGLIVSLLLKENSKLWQVYIVIIPLAFFTGLGNFVTSLNLAVITTIISLYLLVSKNKKWKRVLPIFVIAITALIIICIAPGNLNRQSNFEKPSAIFAIFESFKTTIMYILSPKMYVTNKYLAVIALLFTAPFLSKIITNKEYSFKYPLVVLILSYCVFSSLFTPTLYAFHRIGPHRIQNINYFAFIWFVELNIIYIAGWFYNRLKKRNKDLVVTVNKSYKDLLIAYYVVLVILFALTTFSNKFEEENEFPTSIRALQVIRNGTGKQYALEYQKRLELLESDEKNLILEPYSVHPDLLYFNDMDKDPTTWPNDAVARFYNKESIIVKSSTEK